MDAKITLSFDEEVIEKAKRYAASKNVSLSRLTEMLLRKITTAQYKSLEDFPISDWVNELAEGEIEYRRKSKPRKSMRKDFFEKK